MRVDVLLTSGTRRTGAFITTLDLAEALRHRGHEVEVNPSDRATADVTISHLGDPRRVTGKHFLMAHGANARLRRRLPRYDLMWFPSKALARWYLNPPRHVVVPPPIDPYDYLTTPGDHVTLAEASPAKGSSRLRQIAQALPHIPFLAVLPEPAPAVLSLPNLTVVPRFDDARDMYSLSRIMVMPSSHESYGRVAVEAAVSGIPTIAADLPGIREATKGLATFLLVTDLRRWVERIDRMWSDPHDWNRESQRAQELGDGLDHDATMDALVEAVESCASA